MSKTKKDTPNNIELRELPEYVRQAWLTGLSSIEKAQKNTTQFFETLVKEGEKFETRNRKATEKKIESIRKQTTQQRDKLNRMFQDRVAEVLKRVGIPTKKDIQRLSKRIDSINANLNKLRGQEAGKPKVRARKTRLQTAA